MTTNESCGYAVAFFHFTINFFSSWTWMTYASVAYKAASYYNCSLEKINELSLYFMVLISFVSPFALLFISKFGLNKSLLLSAWGSSIGCFIRLTSAFGNPTSPSSLPLVYVGQLLVAVSAPFSLVAPATTACTFFPPEKRIVVTTFITTATLLGIVAASSMAPSLYVDGENLLAFELLATIVVGSLISTAFGTIVITREAVWDVENSNSSNERRNVLKDVKKLFKNINTILLILCVGSGFGLVTSFATIQEQILCPVGYTDVLSGISTTTLTCSGIIGAFFVSLYCDRTRQLSTAIKFSFVFVNFGLIIFLSIYWNYLGAWIIPIFALFGFLAIGILPVGIELAIQAVYPISSSTVSGVFQLFGNVIGGFLIYLIPLMGKPLTHEQELELGSQCVTGETELLKKYWNSTTDMTANFTTNVATNLTTTSFTANFTTMNFMGNMTEVYNGDLGTEVVVNPALDLSIPLMVVTCYVTLMTSAFVLYFKPQYKRRLVEAYQERMDAEAADLEASRQQSPPAPTTNGNNGCKTDAL